ncbi:MAG: cobalt-precorrin-5B (C(1))-methyltransferase CbiD [Blautia sp.]|jgi:cobalt-precorrin-5B (C1)-methyltransferase
MNGLEGYYVIKNNKKLRFGYTTGSCAAAAAKGAVRMLLEGKICREVELSTPKGILLHLSLEDISMEKERVSCCVIKDGGDDPDATHGAAIYAVVSKCSDPGIHLDGGSGVGRVTKPGLEQPVGSAAINSVPRRMIEEEAKKLCQEFGYEGGLEILISVPEGEKLAKRTFNPRLGIEGGISILGTSGIVEPMSEAALIKSIEVEMRQRIACKETYLLVTPGNYGQDYLRSQMDLPAHRSLKCSNYVGETIDMAISLGVQGILFVAHIGKFVKVAAGIMNTHSHSADARMEVLAANAVRAGADLETVRAILDMGTTDEALTLLKEKGFLEAVMAQIMERIQFYLDHRSYERILLGAVVFSNEHGYLGKTAQADCLIQKIKLQK